MRNFACTACWGTMLLVLFEKQKCPGERCLCAGWSLRESTIRCLFLAPSRIWRVNAQTPPVWGGVCVSAWEPDDYLLSHGQSALSSAWSRFTVLFGMGRGGTDSLWSSGMTCCQVDAGVNTTNLEEVVSGASHQGQWGGECIGHNADLNRAGRRGEAPPETHWL